MISVIIPTLDEAANLPQLLSTLTAEIDDKEIILVDGGSRDGTVALARAHGVTVVKTEPCRGAQLRLGAQAARGELLLFLHADSVFPARWVVADQGDTHGRTKLRRG